MKGRRYWQTIPVRSKPFMIRHSCFPRTSVNNLETISSGQIKNRISSWTQPCPSTPPPTEELAKSSWKAINVTLLTNQKRDHHNSSLHYPSHFISIWTALLWTMLINNSTYAYCTSFKCWYLWGLHISPVWEHLWFTPQQSKFPHNWKQSHQFLWDKQFNTCMISALKIYTNVRKPQHVDISLKWKYCDDCTFKDCLLNLNAFCRTTLAYKLRPTFLICYHQIYWCIIC